LKLRIIYYFCHFFK